MMARALAILLFLCGTALTARAQRPDAAPPVTSKPAVTLTFGRRDEDGSVWLRLRNNTGWAIRFRTENAHGGDEVTPLTLGDGRQVRGLVDNLRVVPEYFFERAPFAVTPGDAVTGGGQYWCTASTSWLPPGRSVAFSFPGKDLRPWERLYVLINYEWESEDSATEHRVKFQGSELSKHK